MRFVCMVIASVFMFLAAFKVTNDTVDFFNLAWAFFLAGVALGDVKISQVVRR